MSEENRAQHKVMEAQVDKLTTMMQALLKFRAGIDENDEAGAEADAAPPSAEDIATKEAGTPRSTHPHSHTSCGDSTPSLQTSHHHPTCVACVYMCTRCIHRACACIIHHFTSGVSPHMTDRTNEKKD